MCAETYEEIYSFINICELSIILKCARTLRRNILHFNNFDEKLI